jgi:hypothetical protein
VIAVMCDFNGDPYINAVSRGGYVSAVLSPVISRMIDSHQADKSAFQTALKIQAP